MKIFLVLLLGWMALLDQAHAQEKPFINLYTASIRGTYHRMGEDIERACGAQFNIQVIPTDGSLANVNNLIVPQPIRGFRLAFIQQDALSSIMGSENRVRGLLHTVMTLYSEEISILVSKESKIDSIEDLAGKRVAIGVVGSGVWFTSQNLQRHLNTRWIPVERGPDEALLGVVTGELDAMVMVAGQPFNLYNELGKLMKSRIKLLDLGDVNAPGYEKKSLKEQVYPWQDQPVELLSTRALLAAARDVPESIIKDLLSCIVDNQTDLKRWGHPKWKEVKFAKRR
jgi:TRAP transporter TAXI family solute receptor